MELSKEYRKQLNSLVDTDKIDFGQSEYPNWVHPTWYKLFPLAEANRLKGKINPKTICPKIKDTFRPFFCNINDINMIWVGQSPYPKSKVVKGRHIPVDAMGLAFATDKREYKDFPYSLKVIWDSINNYLGEEGGEESDLWTLQDSGVMLLNSQLTVEAGKPNSHKELWRPFMTQLFKNLNDWYNPIIFVFFGKDAQEYSSLIGGKHYKFNVVHPAATKYNNQIVYDYPYTEIADVYRKQFKKEIRYKLPF